MKQALMSAAALLLLSGLGACNTVAGIGEDLTSASKTVQREISNDNSKSDKPNQRDDELLGGPDGGL